MSKNDISIEGPICFVLLKAIMALDSQVYSQMVKTETFFLHNKNFYGSKVSAVKNSWKALKAEMFCFIFVKLRANTRLVVILANMTASLANIQQLGTFTAVDLT